MKRAGLQSSKIRPILLSLAVIALVVHGTPSASAGLYAFTSHTFTACANTGNTGPSQASCRSAYSTTWDESDSNFKVTSGVQIWTVPISATYSIQANGAAAGARSSLSVGLGASIQGEFTLLQGETLSVLVGQRGTATNATSWGQGGGGGTFVIRGDGSLLVIAGGGGSIGNGGGDAGVVAKTRLYADASITTTAKSGDTYSETGGTGGSNGLAGGTSVSPYNGYPGAGLLQDAPAGGAKKFANGMLGGIDATYGNGGFGGGGAAGYYGGSGGGGYSGGGANGRHGPGGGGGSYNSGANKVETLTATAGDGSVVITLLSITRIGTSVTLTSDLTATYRSSVSIVGTVSTSGVVTFLANGKRIPSCINVRTVSSGTIYASCSYRPSMRGNVLLTAQFSPSDSTTYLPSSSPGLFLNVLNRASFR